MKKRWIILMAVMVLISIIGVCLPEEAGVWEPDPRMDPANVAWMITATIFVLMMTPGLSFFYGGMGPFLGLSGVYSPVFHLCILPAGALDMASRGLSPPDGGYGLCRRYRGPCLIRRGGPCGSYLPWQAE